MQYEKDGNIIFECDACGQKAKDIGPLVLSGLVIIRSKGAANSRKGEPKQ